MIAFCITSSALAITYFALYINFGIVYGISDFGLSQQIKVSRSEAAGYIENYFARYTGVKQYMDGIVELARKQGYVTTLLGRRRYLPEIIPAGQCAHTP